MYLGLCINNDDPQKRGRVQVFIPHIMPALYKGWNEDGKDIEISCVGDNIEGALPSDVLERLKKILPWAEAAAPIFGTSAPGNLVNGSYDQSPVASPPYGCSNIAGNGDLGGAAQSMIGTSTANIPGTQGGNVGCAAAVSMIFKNATGQDILPGRSIVLGTGELYNHMSNSNNWVPVNIDQMQAGDVLVTARGSRAGHTGVYAGNGRIISNSSGGFAGSAPGTIQNNYSVDSWKSGVTTRNPGASGVFRYVGPSNGSPATGATTAGTTSSANCEETSVSDQTAAGANPHMSPQGAPTMTETKTNQYGVNADPTAGQAANIAANTAPTIGGTDLSSSGISAGALEYAMRTAAAESGAGINAGNATATYVNNVNNTIAMSQGIKNGYEVRGVSFDRINQIAGEIKSRGLLNKNLLDIGYTQHNANDMKAYGIRNYGSYRDQVLSVARHVQNQANKNPTFAAALNSRNFSVAESLNGGKIVPGWNNSIYRGNHLSNKNALTNLISTKYNGNVEAALADLSTKYPDTPSIDEQLAGVGSQSIAGGDSAPVDAASLGVNTNLVNNTNSYGAVAQVNVNNMAKGLFSYPAAGAMLWCFFREGNPLYPVYFGVSYSSSEWSSAYRTGSPGIGYNPNPQDGSPRSTGGALNLNGVGGLHWADTTDPLDSTKNEKIITFFGEDGSNLFFGAGLTQFYSKFNRRDQVDGDRWQTTLGFKEEWVQGDSNQVVMGDLIVKVGNVGQPAVDAASRIQEIIKEIQKPLTESS